MKSLSNYGRLALGLSLLAWSLFTLFIVLTECRFPGTDVFLFKEAAINFALKTKLVASNLVYMPLDTEMPFAHYPPVYPIVFGLWMKVFGIGLKQSLLFECLLRGLRSVLLGALIWPVLKEAFTDNKRRIWAALSLCFLVLLSLTSTDDDRPDELALVIGLSSWWLLQKAKHDFDYLLAGLFLGLTGAASPACGVCIGLGMLFYQLAKVKKITSFCIMVLGTAISFTICILPALLAHQEIINRFSISAHASSVPYPFPWNKGVSFAVFWSRFSYCINHYFFVGFKLIYCCFCSFTVIFLMRERVSRIFNSFQSACFMFFLMAPFIWSLQPYYLWFSALPIAIIFLGEQLKVDRPHRAFGFIGIFVAFFPLFVHESKNFISILHRPEEESASSIREVLLKHIKPEQRVAVSSDQFFTLRNHREVANVRFVCSGLDRYDFVYVTRIWSAKQGHTGAIPIPCGYLKKVKCFEPIENLSKNFPLIIAGWNTGYVTRGNGGTLYENTNCHDKLSKIPEPRRLSKRG